MKDLVHHAETCEAELSQKPAHARVPCPACGAETKEHHEHKLPSGKVLRRRICSNKACRRLTDAR